MRHVFWEYTWEPIENVTPNLEIYFSNRYAGQSTKIVFPLKTSSSKRVHNLIINLPSLYNSQ